MITPHATWIVQIIPHCSNVRLARAWVCLGTSDGPYKGVASLDGSHAVSGQPGIRMKGPAPDDNTPCQFTPSFHIAFWTPLTKTLKWWWINAEGGREGGRDCGQVRERERDYINNPKGIINIYIYIRVKADSTDSIPTNTIPTQMVRYYE